MEISIPEHPMRFPPDSDFLESFYCLTQKTNGSFSLPWRMMIFLPVGLNELLGHIHIISVGFTFVGNSCLCCLLEKDRQKSFKNKMSRKRKKGS